MTSRGTMCATPISHASTRSAPRGWTRAPQCGWCELGDDHRELLEELHREHVRRAVGARALAALAQRRLGADVPSARALSRHLARHLARAVYEVEDDVADAAGGAAATGPAGLELDALFRLHRRLERRIKQLDEATSVTGGDGAVDLNRIAQLAGLANAQRATLAAITKVRSSPPIVVGAIQHALKLAMVRYTAAIVDELSALGELAERSRDPELSGRFREAVVAGGPIRQAALRSAKDAFDETLASLKVAHPVAVESE